MTERTFYIEVEKLPYAHQGGAWKVAYADFVTAMMAFFLLMWLLNVVTEEQKNAITDYFNPSHPMVSRKTSGAGGVMGGLTMSPEGAMASQAQPLIPQQVTQQRKRGATEVSKVNEAEQRREQAEKKRFERAAQKIKEALEKNPELQKLKDNVLIDITPEGLRIQIIDRDGESMFPSGSARMFDKTRLLLEQITKIVLEMPNEISVRGHTDAVRYAKGATYTNWELSSDRANASRRVMIDSSMPEERLNNVMGKADTELLITDNPIDPRNRRITLILLKESLTNPLPPDAEVPEETEDDDFTLEEPDNFDLPYQIPDNPYQKTPGAVEFP